MAAEHLSVSLCLWAHCSPTLCLTLWAQLTPFYSRGLFLASVLSVNHEPFQKCSTPVPFLGFLPLFTLSPPSWCCCFRPWPDAETSLTEGSHSLLHSWLIFTNYKASFPYFCYLFLIPWLHNVLCEIAPSWISCGKSVVKHGLALQEAWPRPNLLLLMNKNELFDQSDQAKVTQSFRVTPINSFYSQNSYNQNRKKGIFHLLN